jgi:long-chain acyl-CoA synthetase
LSVKIPNDTVGIVLDARGDLAWPLERSRRVHGAASAVIDGDRELTYGALADRVSRLGGALDALAIPHGARVGVLAANSLAHLECWLAVPAYGRVIVDLNFRLSPAELRFMAEDAGLEIVFADAERLHLASSLGCPAIALSDEYERLLEGDAVPPPGSNGDALAAISYTGGTTGTPKGVMLSHENLLANARHNLIATGHRRTDRWLHVCPMFHVAGTANVQACTWVGATQVILPRFEPGAVVRAIAEQRITHTVLVPTMLAMLLDRPGSDQADLSSLRHVQYAASPISPDLQRRVLARLDCDVAQFYGMTEAAPTVAHCTPEDHRHGGERLASMGAPVVGVQVEVRRIDGQTCEPGEIGEVWVRGPNVMLGYWNRPDATAAALQDGWYRTGDAARMDHDGYLYMVDRLKDMIITGGENVYSVEVEAALADHDAVVEAAVFGVPDTRWGEAVHAVVTVPAGVPVTTMELERHCRERIAGFKVPRSMELTTEPLPKSGAGKILKHRLRARYWDGRDRSVN